MYYDAGSPTLFFLTMRLVYCTLAGIRLEGKSPCPCCRVRVAVSEMEPCFCRYHVGARAGIRVRHDLSASRRVRLGVIASEMKRAVTVRVNPSLFRSGPVPGGSQGPESENPLWIAGPDNRRAIARGFNGADPNRFRM